MRLMLCQIIRKIFSLEQNLRPRDTFSKNPEMSEEIQNLDRQPALYQGFAGCILSGVLKL
jgi:hypothetical protein